MFYVCASFHNHGLGRVDRMFVVEAEQRPDAPRPCNPQGNCEIMGREGRTCANDNLHVPYPYNGMGTQVISGPYASEEEAFDQIPAEWK